MNWETLLCWGDSITIGARSYLAYPEYAGQFLFEKTQRAWHTPIHATCGFTASDLNRSLTDSLPLMLTYKPSFLSILIGTNDLKAPTSERGFRIAYRQVLIKANLTCPRSQILAIKIPKLKDGVMYPYQISMNERVMAFNEIIDDLAGEFGVRTMELDLVDSDFYDGVHLTESGSEHVGWQLLEFIMHDRGLTVPLEGDVDFSATLGALDLQTTLDTPCTL